MLVAEHGIRAEGRGLTEIRELEMETSIFPRTHGSAFFQRGETQSLVTCVLGTIKGEQIVDGLMPEYAKKFYLHYNFHGVRRGSCPDVAEMVMPAGREVALGSPVETSRTIRLVSDITSQRLLLDGLGVRAVPRPGCRGPDRQRMCRHLRRSIHLQ